METASTIGTVVAADTATKPVSSAAPETGKEAPVSTTAETPVLDAVTLELGGKEVKATGQDQEGKTKGNAIAKEDAMRAAKAFQEALNRTAVSFDVAVQEGNKGKLRFQVVDRQTGKVVREFPPEEYGDKVRKFLESGGGLVDEPV